jgi:hypothetical protein
MTIVATCPECGFVSPEIRCPRCNALKVRGCDGVCSACASSCKTPTAPGAPRPSDSATDDEEHPGTSLER